MTDMEMCANKRLQSQEGKGNFDDANDKHIEEEEEETPLKSHHISIEEQPEVTVVDVQTEEEEDDWDRDYKTSDDKTRHNLIVSAIKMAQHIVSRIFKFFMDLTRGYLFAAIFIPGYTIYFIAAIIYRFGDENSIRLLVGTILGVLIASRHLISRVLKCLCQRVISDNGLSPDIQKKFQKVRIICRWISYIALIGCMIWVLVDEGRKDLNKLSGLPGLFIMIFICMFLSTKPENINWHTIIWSIGMQFIFAVCTLRYQFGRDAMFWFQDRVDEYFANGDKAFILVFGKNYLSNGIAFSSIPLIFFVSATFSVMYHVGAMQFLVEAVGHFFRFVMDVDYVESISVAGGIFIEAPQAAVSLRPYLHSQSKSQLFTIITSTFSSLGGTFLAVLVAYGVPLHHVIPAMLISAPATFTVCKLWIPEERLKQSKNTQVLKEDRKHANILDAFQAGAISSLPIFGYVIAVIFAFFSGTDWINHILEWFGDRVGFDGFDMGYILSYLFYPVALVMGISPSECKTAGRVLGIRVVSANLMAFLELKPLIDNRGKYEAYMMATNYSGIVTFERDDILLGTGENATLLEHGFISEKTEAIMTYSLSGLSSILSLGLSTASFYSILPKRRVWLAKIAVPALIAGNIANYMTGCFAGIFL